MRKQNGQTLLEVLIALSIAVVVIAAVVSSIITSLSNIEYTQNQKNATFLAQQAFESLRELRDTNPVAYNNLFSNCGGKYCLGSGNAIPVCTVSFPNAPCGSPNVVTNNTNFIREVDLLQTSSVCNVSSPPSSSDASEIVVKVSWSDQKCVSATYCHNVTLDSCLSGTVQSQSL
jgi:type II secretory pathway pseudopilin PulG